MFSYTLSLDKVVSITSVILHPPFSLVRSFPIGYMGLVYLPSNFTIKTSTIDVGNDPISSHGSYG